MSTLNPALIARLYKAIDQNKASDAVLLLTQAFDAGHVDANSKGDYFLRCLRTGGEELQDASDLELAEQHFALAVALYDRFFPSLHHEGLAAARRLSEVQLALGKEVAVSRTLDQSFVIVQRLGHVLTGEDSKVKPGQLADSLGWQHRLTYEPKVAASLIRARRSSQSTAESIRVLLVEDSPEDAELIKGTLANFHSPAIVTEWVDAVSRGIDRLSQQQFDVIVLDLTLPDSQSLETLSRINKSAPTVPVIVLTGSDERETALSALQNGAHDYLIKGKADASTILQTIVAAAEGNYTVASGTNEGQQKRAQQFMEYSPLPMLYISRHLIVREMNEAFIKLVGDNWLGRNIAELWTELGAQDFISGEEASAELYGIGLPNSEDKRETLNLIWWQVRDAQNKTEGVVLQCTKHYVADNQPIDLAPMRSRQQMRQELAQNQKEQDFLKERASRQTALADLSQLAQAGATREQIIERAIIEIHSAFNSPEVIFFNVLNRLEHGVSVSSSGIAQTDSFKHSFDRTSAQELLNAKEPTVVDRARFGESKIFANSTADRAIVSIVPTSTNAFGIIIATLNSTVNVERQDKIFLTAVCNIVGTAIDRIAVEKQLQHASVELQRSNLDLQQFASAAAHDLQEPLRAIVSYLDLLKGRLGDLDEKSEKYMNVTTAAAKRMQNLINDLLEYSRISSRPKEPKPTDIAQLLDYVESMLSFAIEESGAVIKKGEMPVITVETSQLAQVFQNLIANAIKFRGDRTPEISITSEKQGEFWLFTVADNGIGLDMQYADRIFVVFQRLHGRTKYVGTGIGLSLCKKIIERHGGKIWVESSPGNGAKFLFTIPT